MPPIPLVNLSMLVRTNGIVRHGKAYCFGRMIYPVLNEVTACMQW